MVLSTQRKMLTIYFSATGNTKFIAELFSRKMDTNCLSIEDDVNFTDEIKANDIIAFCYPIYGSRVPRIMREFVAKYMNELTGKKLIIFVTQMMFSGDGARVFTDMFWDEAIEVIYAEHFSMPNNICNFPLLRKPSQRKIARYLSKAEIKMERVCQHIKDGVIVKRGFSRFSQLIGNIQGKPWQGNSIEDYGNHNKVGFNGNKSSQKSNKNTVEQRAKNGVKVSKDCTVCNLCISLCPMRNLDNDNNEIKQNGNCIICYRCVNKCPHKAITVMMFHRKPKWQYEGIISNNHGGVEKMAKKEMDYDSIDFTDPDDYAPDTEICSFCGSESDERIGYNEKLDLLKRSCSNCGAIYIDDGKGENIVLKGEKRDWAKYLSQHLIFPFEAIVDEISDEEFFGAGNLPAIRYNDKLTVIGVGGDFDLYGIIVDVKKGKKKYAYPLCDLEVVDKKSSNYKLVADYNMWFANCQ